MNPSRRKHSKRRTSPYRYRDDRRGKSTRRSRLLKVGMSVTLIAVSIFVVLVLRKPDVTADNYSLENQTTLPNRVISLAPSITETIFALGADSLLVGVTQYCKYPDAADTLPEVGGFLDPNLEALLALDPDLVVMLQESDELAGKLKKLGLVTLMINHQTVTGILESFSIVGAKLGMKQRGDSIRFAHETRIENIKARTRTVRHPTALVSIGHSDQPGIIKNVYVTGHDDFYSALLEIAGGKNVVSDSRIRYPVYDTEGITALDPEYILDIFPTSANSPPVDRAYVLNQWSSLSDLSAVRQNRVIVLEGTHLVIPGPRMLLIAEAFLSALHPQIAAELSVQ